MSCGYLSSQDAAVSLRTPLHVVHLVVPRHTFQPTLRHLSFHLKGIEEFAEGLADNSIAFHCFPVSATDEEASMEEAHACIEAAVAKLKPSIVVCDFMPLRWDTGKKRFHKWPRPWLFPKADYPSNFLWGGRWWCTVCCGVLPSECTGDLLSWQTTLPTYASRRDAALFTK